MEGFGTELSLRTGIAIIIVLLAMLINLVAVPPEKRQRTFQIMLAGLVLLYLVHSVGPSITAGFLALLLATKPFFIVCLRFCLKALPYVGAAFFAAFPIGCGYAHVRYWERTDTVKTKFAAVLMVLSAIFAIISFVYLCFGSGYMALCAFASFLFFGIGLDLTPKVTKPTSHGHNEAVVSMDGSADK